MSTNRAEQLADEHWDNYVGPLAEAHGSTPLEYDIAKFHYKSAFMHGYKHALEDVEAERKQSELPVPPTPPYKADDEPF